MYAGAQIPKHDDDDNTLFRPDGYKSEHGLTVDQVVKLGAILLSERSYLVGSFLELLILDRILGGSSAI